MARVNALGDRLRDGLNGIFRSLGILGQATGLGSLAAVQWRDGAGSVLIIPPSVVHSARVIGDELVDTINVLSPRRTSPIAFANDEE